MSENILEVKGLTKDYGDFVLDKLTFTVPKGVIMGLIGENGAGKSTTINCILNEISKTDGNIEIFGKDYLSEEIEIKDKIGVVFDENHFPDIFTPNEIGTYMSGIYSKWERNTYVNYLSKFELPADKRVKDFSKGMKVKLAFAVALSHKAELLILDEATSGLDPIIRDDILDILFLAFVLPSNYSLGVNAGFATMFILIILLVVLGLWTKATNNSIMWFVVENFEVSIAIAGVSVVAICGLSFVLSNLFFRKKYI